MRDNIFPEIIKNGQPLHKSLYRWDVSNETFICHENDISVNFTGYGGITFVVGYNAKIYCEENCTIDCEDNCTIICYGNCVVNAGHSLNINCGAFSNITCLDNSTIKCGRNSSIITAHNTRVYSCNGKSSVTRIDTDEIFIVNGSEEIELKDFGDKGLYDKDDLLIKDIIK